MRTKLAVVGATALVLTLTLGWYQVGAVVLAAYVVWTCVRTPIERRDRLRQVDPGWHRHRTYDHEGRPTDGQD